jgi:hypothetical protein
MQPSTVTTINPGQQNQQNPDRTLQASMIRGKLFEMLVLLDPEIGKNYEDEESRFFQRTHKSPEAQEILFILQNPQQFPEIYGETKGIKNPDAIFLNLNSPQIEILGVGDAKLGVIDIGDLKQFSLFRKSIEIIAAVLNQYNHLDLEAMGFPALSARKYIVGTDTPLITVNTEHWQQIVYVPRDRQIINAFTSSFKEYYHSVRASLLDKKLSTKKGNSKPEKILRDILRYTRFVPSAFTIDEIVHLSRHINNKIKPNII